MSRYVLIDLKKKTVKILDDKKRVLKEFIPGEDDLIINGIRLFWKGKYYE